MINTNKGYLSRRVSLGVFVLTIALLARPASAVPKAPSNLAATAVSTNQINLSWTDNGNSETGFKIERAPDSGGVPGAWAQIATVGASVATYGDTGLSPNTTYWYRVRSYNNSGNSAYSNEASARTFGIGILSVTPATGLTSSGSVGGPFSPASQVYTLTNSGSAALNWSASKSQSWVSFSATNGTLAVGAAASVTVSINSNANSLAAGNYSDLIAFTNLTNGNGTTNRSVSLTVAPRLDHFSVSSPANSPTSGVSFTVTITARDATNGIFTGFTGSVALSITSSVGAVSLSPTTSGPFTTGQWTGSLTINSITLANVTIGANDGSGHTGQSNPFYVVRPATNMFIASSNRVDMVADSTRGLLYITITNQVQRYDLNAGAFLSPFVFGTNLKGIDISPDNNTLVVADYSFSSTSLWVYVVNLVSNTSRKVEFPLASGEAGSWAVAFGNDAAVLFTSGYQGSGWVPMRRYDPATGDVKTVANPRQNSMVSSSGDGRTIGVAEFNSSAGPVDRYDVASQMITVAGGTGWESFDIGVSRDASQFAAPSYGGTFLLDSNLALVATLGSYASQGPIGAAYHPGADLVFFPWCPTSYLRVYETRTLAQVAQYDCGYTFGFPFNNQAFQQGRTRCSRDGNNVFVTVGGGVRWISRGTAPPADLALSESDSPDPVVAGSNLTYSITVTNNGPNTVTDATVFDRLPTGVTFVSASTSQGSWSQSGGLVTFTLGALASGATATMSAVIVPPVQAVLTNVTAITSSAADSNPTNNAATVFTTVQGVASLIVAPSTGLASSGLSGGPFSPASQVYTLTNNGTASLTWSASKGQNWVSLSLTNGTLAVGAGASVTVSINSNANNLAAGSYSDIVTFTNLTNGNGTTNRAVNLVVNAPTPPVANFTASPTNGPAPLTVTFTDTSTGTITNRHWDFGDGAATNTVVTNLVHTYSSAGTNTVTLVASGPVGSSTNSRLNYIVVTNLPPPVLSVSPVALNFTNTIGGPSSPPSQNYTLTNAGGSALTWTASKTVSWLSLSATNGVLAAGGVTNVTVNISSNASSSLAIGVYSATVAFTNATNGTGTMNAVVYLAVIPRPPAMAPEPAATPSTSNTVSWTSLQVPLYWGVDTNGQQVIDSTGIATNVIDDLTEHTYVKSGVAVGQFADCTIRRQLAASVVSLKVTLVSITNAVAVDSADDIGYVGTMLVTPDSTNTPCSNEGSVLTNYDVTSQVTTNGTEATVLLRAKENCCCVTGWGQATAAGRLPARIHWEMTLAGRGSGLPYVDEYEVQQSTATNFASAASSGWITATNYTFSGLSYGVHYYYRVHTRRNFSGTAILISDWSSVVDSTQTDPTPVALFSGSPTNGTAPLTVTFTDTSTGTITNRFWSFGDGSSSNTAATTMVKTYGSAGTNTVSLTVSGPDGSGGLARTNYVVVSPPPPPVADFSGNPWVGAAPLTAAFTNLTTGGVSNSYSWSFGDGGVSALPNPTYTYTTAGLYTVSLTAFSSAGTNTNAKTNYIQAVNPLTADFSGTPTNGQAPLAVTFTNLSTGGCGDGIHGYNGYIWAFGDGVTNSAINPSHTYSNAGSYTVSLTAFSIGNYPCGSSTNTKTNYIVVSNPPPVASFTGSPTNGLAPLTVTFTDSSTGSITNRFWSFGDGSTSNTTATSVVKTYGSAGSNTVSLTVSGPGGANTQTRSNYIVTTAPVPVAEFSGTPTNGTAPLTVTFSNLSTSYTNAFWQFGDGTTSNTPVWSLQHTYASPGSYTVSLTAFGPGGTSTNTKANYIVVAPVVVQYTITSLGTLGGTNSQAWGVNNLNQIVGQANDSNNVARAFLWQNGVMQQLPGCGSTSYAAAINDSGTVVGWCGSGTSIVVWSNGVMQSIPGFYPYDINNNGWVAGGNDCSGGAFVYNGSLHYFNLGGSCSGGHGINSNGTLVGGSRIVPDSGSDHAFVAYNLGSAQDLGALGSGSSSGWDINDAGDIAGVATEEPINLPGLLLQYSFDSDQAGIVTDKSGHGNNATVHGATWTAAGHAGGGMSFDGTSSYLDFPTSAFPSNAQPRTLSAWVWQNEITNRHYIVGYGGNSNCTTGSEFRMALNEFAPGQFSLETSFGGWHSSAALGTNSWYHLVITFDGGPAPQFYVNGQSVAVGSTWLSPSVNTLLGRGTLGNRPAPSCDPGHFHNGKVDDVLIFGRAISAAEVLQVYNAQIPSNGATHLVWWPGGGAIADLGLSDSPIVRINNRQQIVGTSAGHAFLWENGLQKDLNSLIGTNSGWVLQVATSINDPGYIVGYGVTNGQTQAFLLVPTRPIASFSGTPTNGTTPLTVTFTDTSTGTITNRFWNFGDGTTTNVVSTSVVHPYTVAGSYSVSLIVSGPDGASTNSKPNYIVTTIGSPQLVIAPTSLDFGSVNDGQTNTLSFSVINSGGQSLTGTATTTSAFVISSGSPYTVAPGQTGLVNISFNPLAPGQYNGSIVFTSNGGGSTNLVTGNGVAVPRLGVTPSSQNFGTIATGMTAQATFVVSNLDRVTLTGTATVVSAPFAIVSGSPYTVAGFGSTNVVVSFTPTSAGTFSNSVIFDSNGGSSTSALVGTGVIIPVAAFTATPTTGSPPLTVSFTDASTGSITNRLWAFGDGGTSSLTNPTHTYSNAGTYSVSLTVWGPGGSNTLTRTNYIAVTTPPPVAGFTGSPINGLAPLLVTFTNTSTGSITSNLWNFGDSATSINTNPTHTYSNSGTYSVSLTVWGPGGSNSLSRANYITATNAPPAPPVANFTAAPTNGVAPMLVTFTNSSTGSITSNLWNFGDSATSTNTNPTHTYSSAGSYTVSLTAFGPGGSNTLTRAGYITVSNAPSTSATFVTLDNTTQGTWKGVYGADGYIVIQNSTNYPAYAVVTPSGKSDSTQAASTTDVRALQKAATNATDRIAATWNAAGSFAIDLNLTDGQTHRVALYSLDWFNYNRVQTVDILDAATSAVLDSRSSGVLNGGIWLVWDIRGHITIRLTNTAGSSRNAVLNGIFFQPPSNSQVAAFSALTIADAPSDRPIASTLSNRIDSPTNGFVASGRLIQVSGSATATQGIDTMVISNSRGGSVRATLAGTNWIADNVPLRLGTNQLVAIAADALHNLASATVTVVRINTNYVNTTLATTNAVVTLRAAARSDEITVLGLFNPSGVTFSPGKDGAEVLFGNYDRAWTPTDRVEARLAEGGSYSNTITYVSDDRRQTLSIDLSGRSFRAVASGLTLSNSDPVFVALALGSTDLGPDAIRLQIPGSNAIGSFTYEHGVQLPEVDAFFLVTVAITTNEFNLSGTMNVMSKPDPRTEVASFGIGALDDTLAVSGWVKGIGNSYTYTRPPGLGGAVLTMSLDFDHGLWSVCGSGADLGFLSVDPVTDIRLEIGDFAASYPAKLIRKGETLVY